MNTKIQIFFFPRESERKRKRKEKKREACTSYEKKVKDLKKEVYEMKMKKRAVDGKWQPTSHLLLTHTCISLILNFLKPPVSAAISLSSFLQLLSLSLSLSCSLRPPVPWYQYLYLHPHNYILHSHQNSKRKIGDMQWIKEMKALPPFAKFFTLVKKLIVTS